MMLVTFRSNAWGNVTEFGDVAVTLLKMMGHSGTVPSALLGADVPAALARLERQLATSPKDRRAPAGDDDDAGPPVGLRQRAHPLIELLSAAAKKKCDVMWAEGQPDL
jgi:hypothetical protein